LTVSYLIRLDYQFFRVLSKYFFLEKTAQPPPRESWLGEKLKGHLVCNKYCHNKPPSDRSGFELPIVPVWTECQPKKLRQHRQTKS